MIRAQSSESPRTMMSLQMVLAGLFPPENTPLEWNLMLNWQPIPIFMEPEETDLVRNYLLFLANNLLIIKYFYIIAH